MKCYLGYNIWERKMRYHSLKDVFLKNYILGLSSSLSSLRIRGLLAQSSPLEFPIHPFQPGDWVLIQTWKEAKMRPDWEGPFQVLLTTETAVRTAEKGRTHCTRVKPSTNPEVWETVAMEDPLKIKIRNKL